MFINTSAQIPNSKIHKGSITKYQLILWKYCKRIASKTSNAIFKRTQKKYQHFLCMVTNDLSCPFLQWVIILNKIKIKSLKSNIHKGTKIINQSQSVLSSNLNVNNIKKTATKNQVNKALCNTAILLVQ